MQNLKKKGEKGEKIAESFLKRKGYKIVEKNFRTPFGEIDLIVKDGNYIVFVEVKFRNSLSYGRGEEAITYLKKQHIIRSAIFYLKRYGFINSLFRFDIIAINKDKIIHYENVIQGEEFDSMLSL